MSHLVNPGAGGVTVEAFRTAGVAAAYQRSSRKRLDYQRESSKSSVRSVTLCASREPASRANS
jgi:hypothetical protein